MTNFARSTLLNYLTIDPKLGIYVDSQLPLYREKYHDTLRQIAGFAKANGCLASYWTSNSDEDRGVMIDKLLNDLVDGLQQAGVIPKPIPYITISWYVLHFVFIPFIRLLLLKYHGSISL